MSTASEPREWKVLDLLRWTTEYLGGKDFHNARLNAELLLAGTLGVKRLDLYLQFDRPLRPEELAEFKARLRRRVRREPLQYIEGTAAFRDLLLQVDRRVLIPRPETEVLVDEVLRWAGGRSDLTGVDVGTGSGAIALSLATEGPFSRVVATDVSAEALEVARTNYQLVASDAEVEFRVGASYHPVAGERFDVVVSNPPYIAPEESASLDPEVREWEPHLALFAGAEGKEVIEELVAGAPRHLLAGGLFALEVGLGQAGAVARMLKDTGAFEEPQVRLDLSGRERIVLAVRRTDNS